MHSILVRWAGLNHLALITDNIDTTTRFWHGVLGAPLVATVGNDSFRHYFFDVGNGATVAFFEYQGYRVNSFAKPAGVPDKRAVQFDHVASTSLTRQHCWRCASVFSTTAARSPTLLTTA